jgi:Flp pilus assembly protein TadG
VGRKGHQSGQSVVELALSIPVLLTMLFGMLNIGVLITDKVITAYAARQGARLAAELGNGLVSNMTTLQIDQNVVGTVRASTANLAYATLTEIDIYQASQAAPVSGSSCVVTTLGPANGSFDSTTQPYDSYDGTPQANQLHQGFLNTARMQVPPCETSIGVNLKWKYTTPTGYQALSLTLLDYAVMKAAPVLG